MRASSRSPSSRAAHASFAPARSRREWCEERLDDRVAVPAPLLDDRSVGRAVAGGAELDTGDGGVQLPREHRCWTVAPRMGEHGRGVRPAEAEVLEVEVTQHRRRSGHRIERAEQVVAEPGSGDLRGPHRAAGFVGLLEDEHAPTGVGESIRGDQTVRSGADDDGVGHGRHAGPRAARISGGALLAP